MCSVHLSQVDNLGNISSCKFFKVVEGTVREWGIFLLYVLLVFFFTPFSLGKAVDVVYRYRVFHIVQNNCFPIIPRFELA